MKRIACLILFVIGAAVCYGQHRVTLEECQLLARDNYPVIAQQGLIDQLEEFNISNARRNWLPKISLSAMAAYLSEVPEFPSTLNDLFSQLGVNLAAMPNTLYGTTVLSAADALTSRPMRRIPMLSMIFSSSFMLSCRTKRWMKPAASRTTAKTIPA